MQRILFLLASVLCSVGTYAQFTPARSGEKLSFIEKQKKFESWKNSNEVAKKKGWKTFKRWEYEQTMRTNSKGVPESHKTFLSEIFKAVEQKNVRAKSANTSGTWTSVGPSILPPSSNPTMQHGLGRVNCLAFHPSNVNTYWAGVAQGGVWKTTDNGASWTPQTDHLPVTRISDIAVDPNNGDVLYAALGDFEYIGIGLLTYGRKRNTYYGVGIYKSINGGDSWSPTGLSFNLEDGEASLIRKVIVNSSNSNRLVAAGVSGLFTSDNGGDTWTQQLDSLFWDLTQDPVNPNVLYAAGGFVNVEQTGYANILKSSDFGQTWTQLNTGIPPLNTVQRIKIAIAPSNPNIIYAATTDLSAGLYAIYKSTNAGLNWNVQYNSLNLLEWDDGFASGGQGNYDLSLQVSPVDPNRVIIGGINLWMSDDGGLSFDPLSYWTGQYGPSIHADQHFMTVHPTTGVYYICNDGGIYRSASLISETWGNLNSGSDFPTIWTNISNGMAISAYYRISSSKANDGRIMAGAQDNSTVVFNGSSWKAVIGGDGMDNWMDPTDPDRFIGSSQYGNFVRSDDGGFNFDWLFITSEDGEWTTPLVGSSNGDGTLYAGYNNVHVSTDYGDSWFEISNFPAHSPSGYFPEITAIAVAHTNIDVIYAAKRVRYEHGIPAQLFKTSTNGGSWQSVMNGLPDSLYFTSIEISETDENIAWITCAGFSTGNKIFRTSNGGASWQNISGNLPNLPVNCVKQVVGSLNNLILVATDIGLYYTSDSTTGWVSYSAGLPNVIVSDIEVNRVTNKIYVATFGRGIWVTETFDPAPPIDPSIVTNTDQIPVDFILYPSPVSKGSNLSLMVPPMEGSVSVQIFDVSGKLISSQKFSEIKKGELKLAAPIVSGTYILRLSDHSKRLEKKFVVE